MSPHILQLEAIAGEAGAAPCTAWVSAAALGHSTTCVRPEKERTEDGHGPSCVAGGEYAGGEGPAAGSFCHTSERGLKVALPLLKELMGS